MYLAGEEECGVGLVVGEERVRACCYCRANGHPGRDPRSEGHPHSRRQAPRACSGERARRGRPDQGERGGHRRVRAEAARREAWEARRAEEHALRAL